VPLRRLPVRVSLGIALAILLLGELVVDLMGWGPPGETPLWATLLLVAGPRGPFIIAYPTLPWLAILLLGWAFGHAVRKETLTLAPRATLTAGMGLLVVFAVVRGVNGYGNMGLLRDDGSLVQWLHVSKYPPSLTYVALELGLMAVVLAGLGALAGREAQAESHLRWLTVLGRTPMFFYLLHIPLLAIVAEALGLKSELGMGAAYGFAALAVVALVPACQQYARYKAAHPGGWTRYL
jgi:uncharacterized membrane protein